MGTFVQSRFWPTNASPEWWDSKRVFWIRSYARFQKCFDSGLGRERSLIKIHELLCHVWDSLRRHGSGCGTEGLEGLFHCFKMMETNYREQGAQVFKKFFGCMYAGQWVLGSSPEQKAVCAVIDKTSKWKWKKAGRADVSEAVRNVVAKHLDDQRVEFVKWIQLDSQDDKGTQRGVGKIYASLWHGRPRFDLLRIGDGEYLQLQALFLFDAKVYGVGVVPVNVDLRQLPYHYRWPTLLLQCDAPLTVIELDITTVHPVMAIDDVRNDVTFWDHAGAKNGDRIVFHNIFVSHGEFRNPWELHDWSNGGNGDEWWRE